MVANKSVKTLELVLGVITVIVAVIGLYWTLTKETRHVSSPPKIEAVECESEVGPTAVSTLTPNLSWEVSSNYYNGRQSRARIQVGSQADVADMWDYTVYDARDHVIYNENDSAQNLEWGKMYYWRVQVWDSRGDSSQSWGRGKFQLIKKGEARKPRPDSASQKPEAKEPKSLPAIPNDPQVKFNSKLTSLLGNGVQPAQAEIKNAAVAALKKYQRELSALEITFKEENNSTAGDLEKNKIYIFELAAYITTTSNERLATLWYSRSANSPQEALRELSVELCQNLDQEISKWRLK